MPSFDEHGHLMPYSVVELTLPEFEAIFVDGLEDKMHRRALFEDYLRFVEEVKTAFGVPFYQWLAGSFVTTKEFPDDIDTVTFLPYDKMVKKAPLVHSLKTISKSKFRVDASFCPVCKWNHRFYKESKQRAEQWADLYGFSRPGYASPRLPKGVVKLIFLP